MGGRPQDWVEGKEWASWLSTMISQHRQRQGQATAAETEAAVRAGNNQPKCGSDRGGDGGRGSGRSGGSRGSGTVISEVEYPTE